MAQMLHKFRHDLVNLVAVVTDHGVVGNDLLDTEMLENFDFAAAKIAPAEGDVIETFEDLIEGEVKAANLHAVQRHVELGMNALEALNRL
jgi:uncharacterized protein YunC (DUF1805 family)